MSTCPPIPHPQKEKIAKFELSHENKVFDDYSSTLEFFLVIYVCISILVR